MFLSLLDLEGVAVDRGDPYDPEAHPVEEVEAESIEAVGADAEFLEDEEALVLARVDARVKRALEGITDERFDPASVEEALL